MKTCYTVALSSPYAISLIARPVSWLDNRAIANATLHKLIQLCQLAKHNCVYTCPLLVACHDAIDQVQSALLAQMAKYQHLFHQRGISADKFSAPTRYQHTFSVHHRLTFDLLRTIEYYDTTLCLILGARQAGMFINRHTAFRVIRQQQKMISTLLTTLLQVHLNDMPNVTIQEYIHNTSGYKKIAFQRGAIHPKDVLLAIQSDLLPHLSMAQATHFQQQLQHHLTR